MADPKRSGVTAIHSLDRFVFSVPELGVAKAYFTDFGLDVRQVGNRLDLYTFGHPHRWGSIFESGKPKKLEYLALGVYPEDYDPLRRHLEKIGVKLEKLNKKQADYIGVAAEGPFKPDTYRY